MISTEWQRPAAEWNNFEQSVPPEAGFIDASCLDLLVANVRRSRLIFWCDSNKVGTRYEIYDGSVRPSRYSAPLAGTDLSVWYEEFEPLWRRTSECSNLGYIQG